MHLEAENGVLREFVEQFQSRVGELQRTKPGNPTGRGKRVEGYDTE
jgi:hypothetical protein